MAAGIGTNSALWPRDQEQTEDGWMVGRWSEEKKEWSESLSLFNYRHHCSFSLPVIGPYNLTVKGWHEFQKQKKTKKMNKK